MNINETGPALSAEAYAASKRTRITVRPKVSGGRHLSHANMTRIRALSLRVDTCHVGQFALKDYKPEYRLIHDPKQGYAWVEVYYGSGACGWCPTIRDCVIRAAAFGFVVELMDAPTPPTCPKPPAFFERTTLQCWGQIPTFGRS